MSDVGDFWLSCCCCCCGARRSLDDEAFPPRARPRYLLQPPRRVSYSISTITRACASSAAATRLSGKQHVVVALHAADHAVQISAGAGADATTYASPTDLGADALRLPCPEYPRSSRTRSIDSPHPDRSRAEMERRPAQPPSPTPPPSGFRKLSEVWAEEAAAAAAGRSAAAAAPPAPEDSAGPWGPRPQDSPWFPPRGNGLTLPPTAPCAMLPLSPGPSVQPPRSAFVLPRDDPCPHGLLGESYSSDEVFLAEEPPAGAGASGPAPAARAIAEVRDRPPTPPRPAPPPRPPKPARPPTPPPSPSPPPLPPRCPRPPLRPLRPPPPPQASPQASPQAPPAPPRPPKQGSSGEATATASGTGEAEEWQYTLRVKHATI